MAHPQRRETFPQRHDGAIPLTLSRYHSTYRVTWHSVPRRQDRLQGRIVLLAELVDPRVAPLIGALEHLEVAIEIEEIGARQLRHSQHEIERPDRQQLRALVEHQAALQHAD